MIYQTPNTKSKKKDRKKLIDSCSKYDLNTKIRDELIELLKISFEVSGKAAIAIGPNSTLKCIEKDEAGVVIICAEASSVIVTSIVEACRLKDIPCAFLTNSNSFLNISLSVKRLSCFAVRTSMALSQVENELRAKGTVDGIKDLIIRLGSSSL
jgi:ribosomal protein L7Ae-like RNA K-turn-binding protein